MDARIGTTNPDGTRTLPEKTLSGAPVRRPVHTTLDIGSNQFVVLDDVTPGNFDLDKEIEKLRTGASVPVQPMVGEQLIEDPAVRDVGQAIPGAFSNDVPPQDNTLLPGDMSSRGRK